MNISTLNPLPVKKSNRFVGFPAFHFLKSTKYLSEKTNETSNAKLLGSKMSKIQNCLNFKPISILFQIEKNFLVPSKKKILNK